MEILDTEIIAVHENMLREIVTAMVTHPPTPARISVDSVDYPYLVSFYPRLSLDNMIVIFTAFPCKVGDGNAVRKEDCYHTRLEVGYVRFATTEPRGLRWRVHVECSKADARPVFEAMINRLRGLYEFVEPRPIVEASAVSNEQISRQITVNVGGDLVMRDKQETIIVQAGGEGALNINTPSRTESDTRSKIADETESG
ncbi:MAG: hypothetical protein AAB427_00625 [Chloroflexota bacterium]